MTRRLVVLAALPAALCLSGCSTLESLPLVSELPSVPVPAALRIETTLDTPSNLIERALSACDKRIEEGETACVKKALAESKVSIPALVAMLPGCRTGQICRLAYTTEDRIGFLQATASRFVVHWRVDVDLRKPAATIEAVPLTVVQVA